MTKHLHMILAILALCTVCAAQVASSQAITSTTHVPKKAGTPTTVPHKNRATPAPAPAASKQDLEQVKQMIADQHKDAQARFDALQQQNLQLGIELKAAQDKLAHAEERINHLTTEDDPQIVKLQSAVAAMKSTQEATTAYVEQEKKLLPELTHPLTWHYKGVNVTPGGFFVAEALYRSHAENADINTSWSSIPYDAQPMAHLSEFRATARQTRLSLLASGVAGHATLTGYFETDFLGTGYGASEVQGNGYSPRIRQMWGRVQFQNGWTLAGGQMWSLVTTNRTGIANMTEFGTPLIEASQFIGNDYARQTAFRVTKTFDNGKIAAAFAAENAATVGVTPANVPTSITSILAGLSTTGTGALSNTTYSTNVAPDLIAKVAFDPRFGHYEVKAIGRVFRDRLESTASASGHNNTVLSGAIGGAAYFPVFTKKINYIAEGMWGAIGRYGATSTDAVVKPNGDLSPEKSIHALTGIETHPSPRLDWYVFASEEYLPRNHGYGLTTTDNTKCFLSETAYSCSASLKGLAGATSGIWYRFYKGPAGMVQYGANYAYVTKFAWSGVGGAPRGVENIIETSFRYYLP